MSKNKHKITKEIQDRIYLVASQLPPVGKKVNDRYVYKDVTVPGTQVRKEDLKPGTPLRHDAMYRIKQLVYEDHVMNMVKGVQENGEKFITEYKDALDTMQANMISQAKKENSLINKFFKSVQKLWQKKR